MSGCMCYCRVMKGDPLKEYERCHLKYIYHIKTLYMFVCVCVCVCVCVRERERERDREHAHTGMCQIGK